jgi:hypothetical protein
MYADSQQVPMLVQIHLTLNPLIQKNGRVKISRRYGDSQLTRIGEARGNHEDSNISCDNHKGKLNGSIAHEAIMIRGSVSASSSRVFGEFKTCTDS